jgi:hypothetical protein
MVGKGSRSYAGRRAVACACALVGVLGAAPECRRDPPSAKGPDGRPDATASASAETTVETRPRGVAARAWDWMGIVGTGQSLSVGAQGAPGEAHRPLYGNLKLSLGAATVPPFDPSNPALTLVPLAEPIRPPATAYPSAYPQNLNGATPHTAMADEITALFRQAAGGADYVTVHSVIGESGQPMSVIRKGATEVVEGAKSMGRAYAATLFEVSAITRLARAANKTYGVGAIVVTHGESDSGSLTYEDDLVRLGSDYSRDLPLITGQTRPILMLVSQQHSVPKETGAVANSTQAEWRVGVDHPGQFVCSGPKYQYPYAADAVHLTTAGYERLGEKYAEVFFERVVLGGDWRPLEPRAAEVAGSVVTVRFHVPVPPLRWDDSVPPPHARGIPEWNQGRGFEVRAAGAAVAIRAVAIAGDSVRITCERDLAGQRVSVGYAFTSDGAPMPGGTARWGELRDSDPFAGAVTGAPQPNYGVAFSIDVP